MSVINPNASAVAGARNLNHGQELLGRSLNRLSSGSKIVTPSDDAAGLAVSKKLDAQVRRVGAATTNVQNALSYVQTADGFLSGMTKILSRMSELAIFAQDVTKSPSDIALYQQEFSALQEQLRTTIGGKTPEIGGTADVDAPLGTFNGNILFGPNASGHRVTVGDTAGQDMTIAESNLRIGDVREIIKQDNTGAFTLASNDSDSLQRITDALQHVAQQRASLGAAQTRLELASTTLQVESENLSSALSRIRDADVAKESTHFAKYNILVQSGTSMLAQANQSPKSVLQLLQS